MIWKNGGTRKEFREAYKKEDSEDISMSWEEFLNLNLIDNVDTNVYLVILVTDKYSFIKSGVSEVLRLNKNNSVLTNLIDINQGNIKRRAKRTITRKNVKYLVIRDESNLKDTSCIYYKID